MSDKISSYHPILLEHVVNPAKRGDLDEIFQKNYRVTTLMAKIDAVGKAFEGRQKELGQWLSNNKGSWKTERDAKAAAAAAVTPMPSKNKPKATKDSPDSVASDDTETKLAKIEDEKRRLAKRIELAKKKVAVKEEAAEARVAAHKDAQGKFKKQNDLVRQYAADYKNLRSEAMELQKKSQALFELALASGDKATQLAQAGLDTHKKLIGERLAAAKEAEQASLSLIDEEEKMVVLDYEIDLIKAKSAIKNKKKNAKATDQRP